MFDEKKIFVTTKKIYTGGSDKGYPRPLKLSASRTKFLTMKEASEIFKDIEKSKKEAAVRKKALKKTASRKKTKKAWLIFFWKKN